MRYSKDDLYKAYAEHTKQGLDDLHEPGSDVDCAICEQIIAISDDIEGIERKTDKYIPTVFAIYKDTGHRYIIRVTSFAQERRELRNAEHDIITPSEFDSFDLNTKDGASISLNSWLVAHEFPSGKIAQWTEIRSEKGQAYRRNQADQYVQFSGVNYTSIANFVAPQKTNKTKKGNRLQVESSSGSFSISKGDYLVRFPTGRIISLSESEFDHLYSQKNITNWQAE